MVPQNNITTQFHETEEFIEDAVPPETSQDNVNEEQENARSSTLSSLFSNVKSVASDVSSYWAEKLYHTILSPQDPKKHYQRLLKNANDYEQWAEAAYNLDQLEGKEEWKNNINSPYYDYDLLKSRLRELKRAREKREETHDLSQMMFLLRTSLARNLGDMGQPKLYAHTHIGTKKLIEAYINEVVTQMNIICDTESEGISTKDKLDFFINTRQSFGRTALLLSGGATFGLIHFGVIKGLHERKLLPRIISGASSGSIVAAYISTKTDDEIPTAINSLDSGGFDFDVFEKTSDPDTWTARLQRVLQQGVLFDVEILRKSLRHNIPDMTFQEAYNRTRRILNITVSSATVYEMPRLLNYLTAPDVLIWSAVAASCSVPFIYSSAPLMAKDKTGKVVPWNPSGHRWIDGSVENDLPMKKLTELFNVNHFIVCQVNPHVIPFMQRNIFPSPVSQLVRWFLFLAISELQHRMNQLSELGVAPDLIYKVQAIMSQRYYGDITIVPNISHTDFLRVLSNPTSQSIKDATLRGERAIWPKISIIKNHCQIELTLDEIVYRLRLRQLEDSFAFQNSVSDDENYFSPGNSSQPDNHVKRQRPKVKPFSSTKNMN